MKGRRRRDEEESDKEKEEQEKDEKQEQGSGDESAKDDRGGLGFLPQWVSGFDWLRGAEVCGLVSWNLLLYVLIPRANPKPYNVNLLLVDPKSLLSPKP